MRSFVHLFITKYVFKRREICSSCNLVTYTKDTFKIRMIKHLLCKKSRSIFIKIILSFPSTLHRTLASSWFGLAIGSRKNLRCVSISHHVKRGTVHRQTRRKYIPENRQLSTSDICVFVISM